MIAPPELYRGYHNLVVQRRKLPRPSPRRCLFGSPDPKETIKMLQEALEVERARFIRLWGVDPFVKDDIDERTVTWVIRVDRNRNTLTKLTPSKRIPNRPSRNLGPCIYKQTVIPDFLRVRKNSEGNGKKSATSDETTLQQQPQQPQQLSTSPPSSEPEKQPLDSFDESDRSLN